MSTDHWSVALVESRAPHARIDLGVYRAKTRENALQQAGNKYRSLIKRMQTGTFTLDARVCAAPVRPQGRKGASCQPQA